MSSMTSKLLAITLAMGLFGAGIVVGLVVSRSSDTAETKRGRTGMARGSSDRMMNRFQRQLSLSPEQTEKIRAVLQTSRTRATEIRRNGQAEIKKLLSAEQRTKFDAMIQRMNERRAERRKRRRRGAKRTNERRAPSPRGD